MIKTILSLPTYLVCTVFMGLTTAVGLAVRSVTYRGFVRRQTDDAMVDIEKATGNLFRVVGWLFALLLSLTFADAIGQRIATHSAIEGEALAISEIHHGLLRFGSEATDGIQMILVDYTQAVIEHDWAALAHGRLSERSGAVLRRLDAAVLDLEATNATQETLRSRFIERVGRVSDYRLSRLQRARGHPYLVLSAAFLGFLSTMVYFGVYRPRPFLLALISIYTAFVGVVFWLILVLGDPFLGATAIDAAPLEDALGVMRAYNGDH